MEFDFLTPINADLKKFVANLSGQQLGNTIIKHFDNVFPVLKDVNIAIVGIRENRNSVKQQPPVNLTEIRKQLYQLYVGNWGVTIADLGDIKQGQTVADSYFAVSAITSSLLKIGVTTIFLGGSQDLTYPIYRAFDNLDQMVNLVSIDNRFDIGDADDAISDVSYLSKIIIDEPTNLSNFSNIGYQTYYTSQDEINLVEKLFFDAYRLGIVTNKIEITEPILRNADIVSVDLTSLKTMSVENQQSFEPNGFEPKDLCALMRYSGISEKLGIIGVFNYSSSIQEAVVLAQALWYFFEGYSLRTLEYPSIEHDNFLKYIVLAEDQEISFFKSIKTQRWWMEIPSYASGNNKKKKQTLLPCTFNDYISCCEEQIPERWWKVQQKNII